MPFGHSWPGYISRLSAAFLATAAGAQVVHLYYQPLKVCLTPTHMLNMTDYYKFTFSHFGKIKNLLRVLKSEYI